jgi:hypothetical protein
MSAQAAADPEVDMIAMATDLAELTARFNAMRKTENRLPLSLKQLPTMSPSVTKLDDIIDSFQPATLSTTIKSLVRMNDYQTRFFYDDNLFDAYEASA